MSRLGNVLLVIGFLFLLIFLATQAVLRDWHNGLYVPLSLFILFVGGALVKDRVFFKEILSLRATKHGMNMGVLIFLVLIALTAVNFIVVRHNKKWDLTAEKLYSLSDQSLKVAKGLDPATEIYFVYRMTDNAHAEAKLQAKELLGRYQEANAGLRVKFVDQIKQPDLAEEFEVTKSQEPVLVVVAKGKKVRADAISEEAVTNALIKVSREVKKKIYFLTGHGERPLDGADGFGLQDFKKALEEASYEVSTTNLLEGKGVPADADVLAIVGPERTFLDVELVALKDYAGKGGKLFLAVDPNMVGSGFVQFLKDLGVAYEGEVILDPSGQMSGVSAAVAVGIDFAAGSEVTKELAGRNSPAIFYLATALKKAQPTPPGITVQEVVKTGRDSVTTAKLERGAKIKVSSTGPHVLMMTSTGKWTEATPVKAGETDKDKDKKSDEPFTAVVAGDSDFLTNQWLYQTFNRDLALNAFAFLAKDKDLISIRPKNAKTATIEMPRGRAVAYGFIYLLIPVVFFVIAGVHWFRRRGA